MGADQPSSSPVVGTNEKPKSVMCSMVAHPLSELPPELRPRRAKPATAEGDYDVLHYLR
jgi:hypothetical protein